MNPAALIREARRRAELSQAELAARAGVDRSYVSAYESGRRAPGLATLNKLLAAAGFEATAHLEPLGADVDARIKQTLATPLDQRLKSLPIYLPTVVSEMAGRGLLVGGPAAALLQGAPVEAATVDLLVADCDEDTDALAEILCAAFFAVHLAEYGRHVRQPTDGAYLREHSPTDWLDVFESRYFVHVVPPELAEQRVWVNHGELAIPVQSLWGIESRDEGVSKVLARTRELAALGGDDGVEDQPLGDSGLGGDRGDGGLAALAG